MQLAHRSPNFFISLFIYRLISINWKIINSTMIIITQSAIRFIAFVNSMEVEAMNCRPWLIGFSFYIYIYIFFFLGLIFLSGESGGDLLAFFCGRIPWGRCTYAQILVCFGISHKTCWDATGVFLEFIFTRVLVFDFVLSGQYVLTNWWVETSKRQKVTISFGSLSFGPVD